MAMAKKKNKKSKEIPVDSLRFIYEVGDQLEVRYVMHDGDGNPEVTKTPVRVTNVGDRMMGVRIMGKSWGRRFVKGCIINIENDKFKVVMENRLEATIEEIVEE